MAGVPNDGWLWQGLKQSNNLVGPEDAAWVDSCLVKDSDDTWSASLKDALMEIISLGANSNYEPCLSAEPEVLNRKQVETSEDHYYLKNDSYKCPLYDLEDGVGDAEAGVGSTNNPQEAEENIFRVWDLNVELEEEEIVIQLEEALAVTLVKDLPSKSMTPVENMEVNDMSVISDEEKLDDLIAGMADLCLSSLQWRSEGDL